MKKIIPTTPRRAKINKLKIFMKTFNEHTSWAGDIIATLAMVAFIAIYITLYFNLTN